MTDDWLIKASERFIKDEDEDAWLHRTFFKLGAIRMAEELISRLGQMRKESKQELYQFTLFELMKTLDSMGIRP